MREKLLNLLADFVYRRYAPILIVTLLVTVVAAYSSSQLGIKTQFKDMLPQESVLVKEFDRIIDNYESANAVFIGVEGENADEIEAYIEALSPALEKYTDYVRRVDYRNDIDYFREHGMMLLKRKDLEDTIEIFSDLRLPGLLAGFNDSFEREYIDDQERMSTLEGEMRLITFLTGLETWVEALVGFPGGMDTESRAVVEEATDKLVLGDEFMFSPDRTMAILSLRPTLSIDEYDATLVHLEEVRRIMQDVRKDFPGIQVSFSGMGPLGLEEKEALVGDLTFSTIAAIVLILILLTVSFRMWTSPLLAFVALMVAILWTGGILRLVFPYLDLFTAFFAVILIGLGIDYYIHLNSGFMEARIEGTDLREAIRRMYLKVGKGVVTGALTTALVFFTLTFTGLRPLVQLGVTVGTGICLCLVSMFMVFTSLIVLHYKVSRRLQRSPVEGRSINTTISEKSILEYTARIIIRFPIITLALGTALTIFFGSRALRIGFEYDMMKMEPVGMPSVVLQEKIIDKYNISPDFVILTTESVDEARDFAKRFKKRKLVGGVDSISEFLPTEKDQREVRTPLIEGFRSRFESVAGPAPLSAGDLDRFFQEMKRLSDNIIEVGILSTIAGQKRIEDKCEEITGEDEAGNRILQALAYLRSKADLKDSLEAFERIYHPHLKELLSDMSGTGIITLDNLPENIRERYVNNDGDLYLITVFPKGHVWDGLRLRSFSEQVYAVSSRVTGGPIIFLKVIELMTEKSKQATVMAVIVVFLLLWFDFRRLGAALLTILPLALGGIWMIGIMNCLGIKFDFSNIMTVPLIIGIGIDDGVHITHRYLREGRGSLVKVVKYTGRAIFLTSATTIIAFGSMGFASHRGIASMGKVLAIGVAACFITSVFILPALFALIEKFGKKGNTVEKGE